MEVLTVIVAAPAFAGGEAAKTVVAEGVKDAYRSVKEFLSRKYPQIDLTSVEKAPQSNHAKTSLSRTWRTRAQPPMRIFLLSRSGSWMPSRPKCARPADRGAALRILGRVAPHQ